MGLTLHNPTRPERAATGAITAILFGLLFVGWVGEWPLEVDRVLYNGHWRSIFVVFAPLFTPVPGISLLPWQLLLIALAPFCLPGSSAARRHAPAMDRAIFVSIACIAVTFLWGWVHGGSPYFAYYQVWRFLTALLMAYMLMSAVRTEHDLVILGKLVVLAALIRAMLCIYYFWTHLHGRVFYPPLEYVTNHDDSMLFVVATLIILIWAFLKGGKGPWITVALLVPFVLYAMALNKRRIAWVELGLSLPVMYLLIGAGPLRSRINKWALWAAPVAIVYLLAGLGSKSAMFAPVHALMTTGSNFDPSSLTRQEEARNLLHTLVDLGNPILGLGWGRPYDKAESYWSNYVAGWIFPLYTPHNSLLGVAVYSGLFGIIGIWGVVPVSAYLAARGYRRSTGVVPRAAGMVTLGALAAYSVHCYGDIGFQSFPCGLIFGAALATAGKIAAWSEALPSARSVLARTGERPAPELRPRRRKGGVPWRRYKPPSQRPDSPAGSALVTKPLRTPTRRLPR